MLYPAILGGASFSMSIARWKPVVQLGSIKGRGGGGGDAVYPPHWGPETFGYIESKKGTLWGLVHEQSFLYFYIN